MSSLTEIVMDQTKQFCDHVTPLIEQNLIRQHSTTLQIDHYIVTVSIVKNIHLPPSYLGKRCASTAVPTEESRSLRQFMEPSKTPSEFFAKPTTDSLLFNNMGHNFCTSHPQPNVVVTNASSYIS
uniref:Uncharacterized protein n=1 Tax=viral metagenome TaxID=1070528 RepID=A0A6C0KRQ3_9ZZZZ